MKKILVIMMAVMVLTVSCGCADSGENHTPMEIIIFKWMLDENGDVKFTDVDVVLSTQKECKELMEKYEWNYDYTELGSIHHQKMAHSVMGRTLDVGCTDGEMWVIPLFENGEPKPMDLTTIASELEVYYNL